MYRFLLYTDKYASKVYCISQITLLTLPIEPKYLPILTM